MATPFQGLFIVKRLTISKPALEVIIDNRDQVEKGTSGDYMTGTAHHELDVVRSTKSVRHLMAMVCLGSRLSKCRGHKVSQVSMSPPSVVLTPLKALHL